MALPFGQKVQATVSVQFDPRQVAEVEALLASIPRGADRALVGAINDTGRQQLSRTNRRIRDVINLNQKLVRRHLRFLTANFTTKRGIFRVYSRFPELSLKYFGARQVKKGVSVKVYKSKSREIIKSAFGPDIEKLNKHVFKRVGKARLPLEKLYGPAVVDVFVREGLDRVVVEDAGREFEANLARRVDFLLLQRAGRIGATRGSA